MGSSEEAAKTSEDLLYVGDPSLLPGGGRDLCLTAPLYRQSMWVFLVEGGTVTLHVFFNLLNKQPRISFERWELRFALSAASNADHANQTPHSDVCAFT